MPALHALQHVDAFRRSAIGEADDHGAEMTHGWLAGNGFEIGKALADEREGLFLIVRACLADGEAHQVEFRRLLGERADGAGTSEVGMAAHQLGFDPAAQHRQRAVARLAEARFVHGQQRRADRWSFNLVQHGVHSFSEGAPNAQRLSLAE